MFLGRNEEIKDINSFIETDKTVLAVSGRRRVGKTSLVIDALKDLSDFVIVNYTCEKGEYAYNLQKFIERVKTALGGVPFPAFTDFRDVFEYLRNMYGHRRFIIFLDEFPYLFSENIDDPRISEFQAIIDESQHSNIKIILCGSSVHFMNDAFSSYANPLYGRADKFIELRPFTFLETKEFFPDRSFHDVFLAYGISGGIPIYLDILLSYQDIDEALKKECFSPNGYFYQEATHFLKSEFDDILAIEKILSYIGLEKRNTSDIAEHTNIKVGGINYHLKKLETAKFIHKVENAFEEKGKETKWKITDPFFRFYYSFISSNRDFILLAGKNSYDVLYSEEREAMFLSKIYELIAPELVLSLSLQKSLPFVPITYKKWRGKIGKDGGEYEIDGVYYDEKNVLFVECKYRNKLVGKNVLDDLRMKSSYVKSGGRKKHYLLMSLKGFTQDLLNEKGDDVFLVKEDEIC